MADSEIDQLAVMMAPLLLAVLGRIAGPMQAAMTMLGAWATAETMGDGVPHELAALPPEYSASG